MDHFPITFSKVQLESALHVHPARWFLFGSTTQTKGRWQTIAGAKNAEEFCELSLVVGDNGSKGACAVVSYY